MIKLVENRKILEIIKQSINSYPNLSFNQILYGLNIVSSTYSFHDEPEDVLKRALKSELCNSVNEMASSKGVF